MVNGRSFFFLIFIVVILFVLITSSLPFDNSAAPAQAAPIQLEGAAPVLMDPANPAKAAPDIIGPDQSGSTGSSGPAVGLSAQVEREQLYAGDHLPLMIRWSNWKPEFGPAFVYARERDLAGMLRMDGPVEKMLMVASYAEVERLMARAGELRAAGVTVVGLNTENGPGMTPPDEMETLNNPDPDLNIVARVARLVTKEGFEMMWGPMRRNADVMSDGAIRTMMQAGVRGLALQEQKFIENQPAQARLSAVNQTRDRYLRLAQGLGIDDFSFHVQIMHQRCPDLGNCVTFVQMLEDIPVDSIAIWSNGPIPSTFVNAIRQD